MQAAEENPFRRVPSLQIIATVRAIEALWKASVSKELPHLRHYLEESNCVNRSDLAWYLIPKLGLSVNQLPLPNSMKKELRGMLLPMIEGFTDWWWRNISRYGSPARMISDASVISEIANHFLNNVIWSDLGCVDGARMWTSYVSTKTQIHGSVWEVLCTYCLEDLVKDHIEKVDWNTYGAQPHIQSQYTLYWYFHLTGTLPPRSDIAWYYPENYNSRNRAAFTEDSIIRLVHRTRGAYWFSPCEVPQASGFTYFRRFMQEDAVRTMIPHFGPTYWKSDYDLVPKLRVLDSYSLIRCFMHINMCERVCDWPGLWFMDYWVDKIGNVEESHFLMLFTKLNSDIMKIDSMFYHKVRYDPCVKLWRIYYGYFHGNDDAMCRLFHFLFEKKDPVLCCVLFEQLQVGERRRFLTRVVKRLKERQDMGISPMPWDGSNYPFLKIFSARVLLNLEERQLFWEFHDREE